MARFRFSPGNADGSGSAARQNPPGPVAERRKRRTAPGSGPRLDPLTRKVFALASIWRMRRRPQAHQLRGTAITESQKANVKIDVRWRAVRSRHHGYAAPRQTADTPGRPRVERSWLAGCPARRVIVLYILCYWT